LLRDVSPRNTPPTPGDILWLIVTLIFVSENLTAQNMSDVTLKIIIFIIIIIIIIAVFIFVDLTVLNALCASVFVAYLSCKFTCLLLVFGKGKY